ncbi:hypothetical protein HS7_07280 [Sulfolobales archaeon HS-7]|nr:hypothetical protein HS7_07280 [Sulfolobales archaeon HS-7]
MPLSIADSDLKKIEIRILFIILNFFFTLNILKEYPVIQTELGLFSVLVWIIVIILSYPFFRILTPILIAIYDVKEVYYLIYNLKTNIITSYTSFLFISSIIFQILCIIIPIVLIALNKPQASLAGEAVILTLSGYPFHFLTLPFSYSVKDRIYNALLSLVPFMYLLFSLKLIIFIIFIISIFASIIIFSLLKSYLSLIGLVPIFISIYIISNNFIVALSASMIAALIGEVPDAYVNYIQRVKRDQELDKKKTEINEKITNMLATINNLENKISNPRFQIDKYKDSVSKLIDQLEKCDKIDCIKEVSEEYDKIESDLLSYFNNYVFTISVSLKDRAEIAKNIGIKNIVEVEIYKVSTLKEASSIVEKVDQVEEVFTRNISNEYKTLIDVLKSAIGCNEEYKEYVDSLKILNTIKEMIEKNEPVIEECVSNAYSIYDSLQSITNIEEQTKVNTLRTEFNIETLPLSKIYKGTSFIIFINDMIKYAIGKLEQVYSKLPTELSKNYLSTLTLITSILDSEKPPCVKIGEIKPYVFELKRASEYYHTVEKIVQIADIFDLVTTRLMEELQQKGCININETGFERDVLEAIMEERVKQGIVKIDKDKICLNKGSNG